ncbi:MAG: hypothetical protein ABI548_29160 [Polyangiaceae bacterium]
MTEKQPQLKTAYVPEETAGDRTVVDAANARADELLEIPSSDPQPPAFNPYKFSRIEVSPELRKEMSQAKPPRLAPEILQDTVPPNRPLAVANGSPDAEVAIPLVTRRRPATAIVVVCLFGVVFILALAIIRSLLGRPEPALAPKQTPTAATETPPAPPQIVAQATSLPVAPTLPIAKPDPEVLATSHEPVGSAPSAAQIPRTKGATERANTAHSSPDRAAPSKPTPPALADTPSVVVTQTVPTPTATPNAPSTPAPARSSWFHK